MNSRIKKLSEKKNKSTTMWTLKEKRVLTTTATIIAILVIGFYGIMIRNEYEKTHAYKAFIGKVVPDSMVCMVNGEIKAQAIIPIEVNGNTYYGCCNSCLSKLRSNIKNTLYAEDPITHKSINKSVAYIRLNPLNQEKALFFESKNTYDKYIQSIKTKEL